MQQLPPGYMINPQTGQPVYVGYNAEQQYQPSYAEELPAAEQAGQAIGNLGGQALAQKGLSSLGGAGAASQGGSALASNSVLSPSFSPVSTTGLAAPTVETTGGLMSSALPAAGIVAGAATGLMQGKGLKKAFKGDKMNLGEQAALALPTFGLSFVANKFASGKGGKQQERDAFRNELEGKGILSKIGKSHKLDLGNGEMYDIGNDIGTTRDVGGKKYQEFELSPEEYAQNGDLVSQSEALAAALSPSKNIRQSFAGYLTRAAAKTKDPQEFLKGLFNKAGLTPQQAEAAIAERAGQGQYSDMNAQEADMYARQRMSAIQNLFGYAPGQKQEKKK